MAEETYLSWFIHKTPATWWHDSGDPAELSRGLELGAVGVTTNPVLSATALAQNPELWEHEIRQVLDCNPGPQEAAEDLMGIVVRHAAGKLIPQFKMSQHHSGYVCAQVNPALAGEREAMLAMGRRFNTWAPNIAVKLPATAAGMDVLEDLIAEGITVTSTVSFTLPQVISAAERHAKGVRRAKKNGVIPGRCFSVIMIGRIDDYLREVAHDNGARVSEEDIRQAGLAITKRAYSIFKERGYEAELLVAALRGPYHMTELAGAKLVMSIHPKRMSPFLSSDLPCETCIDHDVPAGTIDRLRKIPEYIKAYEPDGMVPAEFISFGVTQRTLAQFSESGWKLIAALRGKYEIHSR
jgi:transaldolase